MRRGVEELSSVPRKAVTPFNAHLNPVLQRDTLRSDGGSGANSDGRRRMKPRIRISTLQCRDQHSVNTEMEQIQWHCG